MKKKLLTIGMALALLAAGNGCALFVVGAVAAGGAGTWAYVKGEIKATEQAPLDKAWTATLDAMKDLEFPVTYKAKDALAGELKAVNSSGTTINIYVKKLSESATEIRIRVGTFGDEPLSRTIITKIDNRLTPPSK
jgi:hypothetical protein